MGAARSHCYQRPTPPDSEILSVHRLFIWSTGAVAGPFTVSAPTAALGLTAGMRGTAILGLIGGLWAWAAMPRAYAHAGIDLRGRALAVGEVRRGRRLSAP
mgnify:FL=1